MDGDTQASHEEPQQEEPSPRAPQMTVEVPPDHTEPYTDPNYSEIVTEYEEESDKEPTEPHEAEMVLFEQQMERSWALDFYEQWEIDSDGHMHELSPSSIEIPDDFLCPDDIFREEELREMRTARESMRD